MATGTARTTKSKPPFVTVGLMIVAGTVLSTSLYLQYQHGVEQHAIASNIASLNIHTAQLIPSPTIRSLQLSDVLEQLETSLQQSKTIINELGNPNSINQQLQTIEAQLDSLQQLNSNLASFHRIANALNESLPQLQITYDEIVDSLVAAGEPAALISTTQRQTWLAERIHNNLNLLIRSDGNHQQHLDDLQRDAAFLATTADALKAGSDALGIPAISAPAAVTAFADATGLFSFIDNSINQLITNAALLDQLHNTWQVLYTDSIKLQTLIEPLTVELADESGQQSITLAALISAATLLLLALRLLLMTSRFISNSHKPSDANEIDHHAVVQPLLQAVSALDGSKPALGESLPASVDRALLTLQRYQQQVRTVAQSVDSGAQASSETAGFLAEAADHIAKELNGLGDDLAQLRDGLSLLMTMQQQLQQGSTVNAAPPNQTLINTVLQHNRQLNEAATQINAQLPIVNRFAEQIKLLNLNAAIHCAHLKGTESDFASLTRETQQVSQQTTPAIANIQQLAAAIERTAVQMEHLFNNVDEDQAANTVNDYRPVFEQLNEQCIAQQQSLEALTTRITELKNIAVQTATGSQSSAQTIAKIAVSVHPFKQPENV